MIRPRYNKLQHGDQVDVDAGESAGWIPGIVTDLRRNHQGEMIWVEVTPLDGSGLVRIGAGDIDWIRVAARDSQIHGPSRADIEAQIDFEQQYGAMPPQ